MTNQMPTLTDPLIARTSGVLTPRLVAYLVDLCIIAVLMVMLFFVVAILGFLTFGLAWFLFPLIAAGTGVAYSAVTVGGRHQATFGMRFFGLRVVGPGGAAPDPLVAGIHALFFYVAASTLLLLALDILTGLVRSDRRLLHDVLTGLTVIRA